MVDIARLGIAVDSAPAEKGAMALDRLSVAAGKAEGATQNVSNASKQASASHLRHTTTVVTNTAAIRANNAALQVQAANSKMAAFQQRNLVFQLNDVAVSLVSGMNPMMVAAQQGSQISTIYGPDEGGIGRAFKETGKLITGALTKFPLVTAAVTAMGVGFAGLTYEVNKASEISVGFGDTVKAVFQVITNSIFSSLQPAIAAISPWFSQAWGFVVGVTKDTGNDIIRIMVAAFETIKQSVMALPDVFLVAGEGAANSFLSAIENMVNGALSMISSLSSKIGETFGISMPSAGQVDFGSINLGGGDAKKRLGGFGGGLDSSLTDIANTDYLGQFFDAVQAQAVVNALSDVEEKAGKAGKSLKGAADKAKDAWKGLRDVTDKTAERMNDAAETFGGKISNVFQSVLNGTISWKDAAIQAVQSVLSHLNQVNIAQGGMGLFGGGFAQGLLGGLLGFASGTPYAPGGMALVGERGPEVVHLPRGSKVAPNHDLGRYANDNSSVNYAPVYNIDARGADQAAVARLEKGLAERDRKFARNVQGVNNRTQLRNTRG